MFYVKDKTNGEIHVVKAFVPVTNEQGRRFNGCRVADGTILFDKIIYDKDPVKLCNRFFFVKECWRRELSKLKFSHVSRKELKELMASGRTIYGATWSPQGLIFRIKLNENFEWDKV